jgi:hypothetical protein
LGLLTYKIESIYLEQGKNEILVWKKLLKSSSEILISSLHCIRLDNFTAKNHCSTQHIAEVYMVFSH